VWVYFLSLFLPINIYSLKLSHSCLSGASCYRNKFVSLYALEISCGGCPRFIIVVRLPTVSSERKLRCEHCCVQLIIKFENPPIKSRRRSAFYIHSVALAGCRRNNDFIISFRSSSSPPFHHHRRRRRRRFFSSTNFSHCCCCCCGPRELFLCFISTRLMDDGDGRGPIGWKREVCGGEKLRREAAAHEDDKRNCCSLSHARRFHWPAMTGNDDCGDEKPSASGYYCFTLAGVRSL
jgi:hypothetical protein